MCLLQSYLELSISYNVRQSLNFTEYRFCCAFIFYYLLFFLNLRLSLWVWINPFIKRIILIIDIKLLWYHYIWTKITYLIPTTFSIWSFWYKTLSKNHTLSLSPSFSHVHESFISVIHNQWYSAMTIFCWNGMLIK